MSFTIYLTRDFEQMSSLAADVLLADMATVMEERDYNLGLATGNSPTGLYQHLAHWVNDGTVDARKIRSFNLDEYVGLPGENAQQRALHPESYSYFMVSQLFAHLETPFAEWNVPWGTLIEQSELIRELERHPQWYDVYGDDAGHALVINDAAQGYLAWIRDEIQWVYAHKIHEAGGIDTQIIGVGGRGHVAFHEAGIPFDAGEMLLVELDDNTINNAVEDGHFPSVEHSPRYAISMGAQLVYQARHVLLMANGGRKTRAVTESVLGPVSPDVPISYGQQYAAEGGKLTYVLDEMAGAELLEHLDEIAAKGIRFVDARDQA